MSDSSSQISNARLGIRLFAIYSVFYFGFVLVNAFAAQWSDWIVFGGLNLAIVWGFSLIALAFLLAIIYGFSCTTDVEPDKQSSDDDQNGGER